MIHLSPTNSPVFQGRNKSNHNKLFTPMFLPAVGFLLCMNTTAPVFADTFTKQNDTIELLDNIDSDGVKNVNATSLSEVELSEAPSPVVTIAGKEKKVGIVVDVTTNKLYRYDDDGKVIDGYHVATGKIGRNGKSITDLGIRYVHHIEDYPYEDAEGCKRKANPKAYGPNVLYLKMVDAKTGKIYESNGEFIHGNNKPESIGTHASLGCIRMDNEVIKQFAKEVKPGTYVLIK